MPMCAAFHCAVPLLLSSWIGQNWKPSYRCGMDRREDRRRLLYWPAFFFTVEAMGLLGTNHHVLASLTTTSFVVVTRWHHEDGISGLGPYWGRCSCGRYPEHLEAACVNCPILSRQKLCEWLSELAALWISITPSGLKGKPKLGGTQEVEHVLDNEGLFDCNYCSDNIQVERETLLMENTASHMAPSTF